jgi:hypothetical protein
MDLTEGSETSEKLNLTTGKYPKENTQVSEHGENLKSGTILPPLPYCGGSTDRLNVLFYLRLLEKFWFLFPIYL